MDRALAEKLVIRLRRLGAVGRSMERLGFQTEPNYGGEIRMAAIFLAIRQLREAMILVRAFPDLALESEVDWIDRSGPLVQSALSYLWPSRCRDWEVPIAGIGHGMTRELANTITGRLRRMESLLNGMKRLCARSKAPEIRSCRQAMDSFYVCWGQMMVSLARQHFDLAPEKHRRWLDDLRNRPTAAIPWMLAGREWPVNGRHAPRHT